MRTSIDSIECFEAVTTTNPEGAEVTDLLTGDVYGVEYHGDNARIICPNDEQEVVPKERLDSYLLPRPGELQCNEP